MAVDMSGRLAVASSSFVFKLAKVKFWRLARLQRARRGLLMEAGVILCCARFMLQLLPFRRLTWLFTFPLRRSLDSTREHRELHKNIRWAIECAAAHLPGETVCFPRAIAAQIMCRRRGMNTTLFYGAALDSSAKLTAHVWVQDGAI